jgi:NADH-quinone oxidoreductase subunit C
VIRLSSADTTTAETEPASAPDEVREGLVARLREELGDGVVGHHIRPGDEVWVRVRRDVWREAGRLAKVALRCEFFDFLSAIDWLPSPFGRDMDSQEDLAVHGSADKEPESMTWGYAGGETRFQVFARLFDIESHHGLVLKVDVPDDDLVLDTWSDLFLGANWHERECHEMFGISFTGHPHLVKLYLPGDFEGFPLRKDFPLLSRRVKPWPGIVDVEPMPGTGDGEGE